MSFEYISIVYSSFKQVCCSTPWSFIHSFNHSLTDPLVKISLGCCHALVVEDGAFSHKIGYVSNFFGESKSYLGMHKGISSYTHFFFFILVIFHRFLNMQGLWTTQGCVRQFCTIIYVYKRNLQGLFSLYSYIAKGQYARATC